MRTLFNQSRLADRRLGGRLLFGASLMASTSVRGRAAMVDALVERVENDAEFRAHSGVGAALDAAITSADLANTHDDCGSTDDDDGPDPRDYCLPEPSTPRDASQRRARRSQQRSSEVFDNVQLWDATTGCKSGRLLRAAWPSRRYLKHEVLRQRGLGAEVLGTTLAGSYLGALESRVTAKLRDATAAVAADSSPADVEDTDIEPPGDDDEHNAATDSDVRHVPAVCIACGATSRGLPVHLFTGQYENEPQCRGAHAERAILARGTIACCHQHGRGDLLTASADPYGLLALATGARHDVPRNLAAALAENFRNAWGQWSLAQRRELDFQLSEQRRQCRNEKLRDARLRRQP